MKTISPMQRLRDQAEKQLDETTTALGRQQQQYQQAVAQLTQLEAYEREYQQQLQGIVTRGGVSITDLVNRQRFVQSLHHVVLQHNGHVKQCQEKVAEVLQTWRQDKQRVNAFETLINRSDQAHALKAARQEQKMMDEYAQRAGQKGKSL